MNADDLTVLVTRARAAEGPTSGPPTDILAQARGAARRRRTVLAIGATAATVLVAGTAAAGIGHRRSAEPAIPTPAPTRLVGAHGLVLAVPTSRDTEIEQGSYCLPTTRRTVRFYLPINGPVGSCSVPTGASWPAQDSLSVFTRGPFESPSTVPSGTVAGMSYYVTDSRQTGPGVARTLTVPTANLQFTVGAASTAEANALLATIQAVPDGQTTVAVTTQNPDSQSISHPEDNQPILDIDPSHPLNSLMIEVQDPAGIRGQLPGYLIRTDPPIGTPVSPGTTVTLEFSAGDLNAYVSEQALSAQGWTVTPADQFQPPITRQAAFNAVPAKYPDGGGGGVYGIYLRKLNDQLVWLVTIRVPSTPELRLTAIDADTAQVVADHVFPLVTN